jgi:hypothetical protein
LLDNTEKNSETIKLTCISLLIWLASCSDQPTKLSGKTEIIEVSYLNWACDCADLIETKFYTQNANYEAKEEDCILLNHQKKAMKYPIKYYRQGQFEYYLKLRGKFTSIKEFLIPITVKQLNNLKNQKFFDMTVSNS